MDADPNWIADKQLSDVAKMILFDQLPRNCFRGTPRAFAYDHIALALARNLSRDDAVVDSLPPAVIHFLVSPLIHSEGLADQDLALQVNDRLMLRNKEIAELARPHIIDHRAVVVGETHRTSRGCES